MFTKSGGGERGLGQAAWEIKQNSAFIFSGWISTYSPLWTRHRNEGKSNHRSLQHELGYFLHRDLRSYHSRHIAALRILYKLKIFNLAVTPIAGALNTTVAEPRVLLCSELKIFNWQGDTLLFQSNYDKLKLRLRQNINNDYPNSAVALEVT